MKTFFSLLASMAVLLTGQGRLEAMSKPLVVVLLGAPGAGKGTHAVELSKKYHIPQISTGDLFRANIKNKTALGQKAQGYMEKGQLVPDEVVLDMLFDRVAKPDCKEGYILDGFPRTVAQAEAFDQNVQDRVNMVVLNIAVSDELIVDRVTGRMVCKDCGAPFHKTFMKPKKDGLCDECQGPLIQRKDDTEEVVKERLTIYHKQTQPLINYYQSKSNGLTFANINGEQSKNQVFDALVNEIDQAKK